MIIINLKSDVKHIIIKSHTVALSKKMTVDYADKIPLKHIESGLIISLL